MSDLDTRIRRWCDDMDEDHDTLHCVADYCIHAAVRAVRAALYASYTVMDDSGGADRIRRAIAAELGIADGQP